MKPKRALVLGGGGLQGAYGAGALSVLCHELGPDYFDSVYASSVGVFAGTFYVSGEAAVIENTWRNLVHDDRLISLKKWRQGRQILDLEYLVDIFQNQHSYLSIDRVYSRPIHLVFTLTERATGKPKYLKPRPENLFDAMRASSALPIVHKPVNLGGVDYIDGALADPLPLEKALEGGYDEIYCVYNTPKRKSQPFLPGLFSNIISNFFPKHIGSLMRDLLNKEAALEEKLVPSQKLKIIRPRGELPMRSIVDTNKKRINETIDLGQRDARELLIHLGFYS
jgi:predicted patatin/cPLA2 family phospholipase